jgi:hypothetical protein
MTKIEEYRSVLESLRDWVPFLKKNSGLPGPRGNLELAAAVAETGTREQFIHFLIFNGTENTPEVFVLFCGIVGLGKLAAQQPELFKRVRVYASDPRWRIREAVPTGLQLTGDQDMDVLIRQMKQWIKGNWYERRAAAATLAEPRLLKQPKHAKQVLQVLDQITASMETDEEEKDESYKVLRQGMGYCWSVAVAALPDTGTSIMEKWLSTEDKDIRWLMKENLKKNRLVKMDADWVKECIKKLDRW